jgi:hypothetical protein
MRSTPVIVLIVAILIALSFPFLAMADGFTPDERDEKIEQLERMLKELAGQVSDLKEERAAERTAVMNNQETISQLTSQVDELEDDLSDSWALDSEAWVNKFTLGGYADVHANFGEGNSSDQFDIHRLVLFLGYDFNDWIKLSTETEIEHGFVSEDSGGELVIEQAYLDFLLSDAVNIRAGRVLTPLGIINTKHEPPSFNGVERPSFAKYIIPSTWSSDGIGVFGSIAPGLTYEAYIVGGLDGSEFSAKNGIRGGRIKERPSLHEPAITGRLDYFPFVAHGGPYGQMLRLGASAYHGGLDNGNKGSNPDINGDISIYSADFEYSVARFDFRGAVAFEQIDGAREIGNGTAEEIFGWYLEGAYHFMPDSWKQGKLAKSDAVAFVRYDDFDTQYKMPSGVAKNPAGDREEWTFGVNFYLQPNLVVKADYQIRDDDTSDDLADLFNIGIGWQF